MQHKQNIIGLIIIAALIVNCTGMSKNNKDTNTVDTIYTQQAAMSIYAYQPVRALQIIDSAVIVGNINEALANQCRARIYSMSLMKDQLDSLLGGPTDIRLDTARAIAERVLRHDSVKTNLKRQKDVVEILAYTARMQNDTIGWLQRSREYIDICHQLGDSDTETDALRTEAEIGAAMHCLGQHEQGMAKLDSVINILDASFHRENNRGTFNELDALIIALKRKILLLASHDQYAKTIPVARHILEILDKYEKNPEAYHDGSSREPKNEQKRADYIAFYRNQAQSHITAAYASLGEHGNMLTSFEKIERSVREVTAREHIARYNALQQQMEAERQQVKAQEANMIAVIIGIFSLLTIAFSLVVFFKNRSLKRKNRILAQQIAENVNHMKMYWEEKRSQEPIATPDFNTATEEESFKYINEVIILEKLFLDPAFGRQTIMERFQLSKERVGAIFSKGSENTRLNSYIQQLRLEYAAKLLVEQPDKSIVNIAKECGFSSHTYFSDCFHRHFDMSPSDFRHEALTQDKKNLAV